VPRQRPERKEDEHDKDGQHGAAADVVNPLAQLETAQGGDRDCGDHRGDNGDGRDAALRKPCCRRSDEVGELSGNGVEDGRGNGDAVKPDVPRGEESTQVAECAMGPDVEPPFERHDPVQSDYRCGHGNVEEQHGGDPHCRLGAAEAGGDSYPRASDDAENLREHEIAQAELTVKVMIFV